MKIIDNHDRGQKQDFVGPAETDEHCFVGTVEAGHGKSKDECIPPASESDSPCHEGVGGARQSAYQGIDKDVCFSKVRRSHQVGGTYGKGHGHG